MDVAQELLCVLDEVGHINWAGPAWSSLLGLEPAELRGKPLVRLASPQDRDRLELELEALRQQGSTVSFECRMPSPAGTVLWIRWTGRRCPEGLVLSGSDVTSLREPDRGRDDLVASALDAIVSIDADDLIVEFNPSAERIFGYERPDVLGRPLSEVIVPPAHRGNHRSGVARVAAGAPFKILGKRLELNALRADGNEFPIELTITQTSAEPFRVTAFVRDLSAERAAQEERRQMEARLRKFADIDALTGLMNRRRFEEALSERLSDRRGGGGALLLIDLDHFKFVNDSFGHAAGDDLIKAIARILRDQVREGDVLARLGGDEFALLLPEADTETTKVTAARLLSAVEGARPTGLQVGASIGATRFEPEGGVTAGDLLVSADIALYEAKGHGRGRVEFFAGQPGRSLTWVQRIRAALDEDRFVLHSQPIVDLKTGAVVQEELLIRMIDEEGLIIPPAHFLPTAEAFGLIGEIDSWVVAEAVRVAAQGRRVHVNLSGRSASSQLLREELTAALQATAVDPARLVFELTETAAVSNMTDARAFAVHLHSLGCRMALDDFGTGFGSLTYLRNLPTDFLKIDMEFVRNLASNQGDLRVVEAVVDIAARFGQRTVAEGVEDEGALDLLRSAGVDFAQGYLLGRPAPIVFD